MIKTVFNPNGFDFDKIIGLFKEYAEENSWIKVEFLMSKYTIDEILIRKVVQTPRTHKRMIRIEGRSLRDC